jgi:hypothetical protein
MTEQQLWDKFCHRPRDEQNMKYEQWLEKRIAELEEAIRSLRDSKGEASTDAYERLVGLVSREERKP